jgi:hypothetical protein
MAKLVALISACVLTSLAMFGVAAAADRPGAAPAVYVPSEGDYDALFQRVAYKPCCYNNGRFANSTPKTCYRYGGRIVANQYCERRGYGWNNGPYQGQWNNNYGGYNPRKPCCYNRGQYFNSTPKTCRRYGGQTVPQEYCAYAYGYQGGHGYNYNPNQPYNPNNPYNPYNK